MVRLKTGAGRMLVGPREQGIQGLTFQVVLFGPIRSVDKEAKIGT